MKRSNLFATALAVLMIALSLPSWACDNPDHPFCTDPPEDDDPWIIVIGSDNG